MKTLALPFRVRAPLLACGADLKGAFAIALGDRAYPEEGFGDLADPENLERYEGSVGTLAKRLGVRPKAVVCDMHPGYFSTRFAERYADGRMLCRVQHHEAHIASAIVDNGITGDVIGVAFDGTGYGHDGTIWGGEFFTGSARAFVRSGHLETLPMPGGDAAVREPWRMAASYLYRAFGAGFAGKMRDRRRALLVKAAIDRGINAPLTSSAGRLFDAAASIVFGLDRAAFEAELPIRLERVADFNCDERYVFEVRRAGGMPVVSAAPVIRQLVRDVKKRVDPAVVSARFHNGLAAAIVTVAQRLRKKTRLDTVVLSGGVFQNEILSAKAFRLLSEGGFSVYRHHVVNTNDAGIPIGQIAIAHARARCV